MAIATISPRLTYDDLEFIPQERPGDRHELIDGELFVTPSRVPAHQLVSGRLTRSFGNHLEAHHLGEMLTAPIDVKFSPPNVVVPDLIFVRYDRLGIIGPKAVEGVPDLIVEILSPDTQHRDLGIKKRLYQRFGVTESWTVDLKRRAVTACLLTAGRYRCRSYVDGHVPVAVMPGLAIDLAALFAGL
jgi:Uma2 family endonuclease